MPRINVIQAIRDASRLEMARDPRTLLIGQSVQGSLFGTGAGLVAEFGPERVVETPLAESTILDGAGKKLATTGADGSFEVPAGTDEIEVSNAHYAPVKVAISGKGPLTVTLERPLERTRQ